MVALTDCSVEWSPGPFGMTVTYRSKRKENRVWNGEICASTPYQSDDFRSGG